MMNQTERITYYENVLNAARKELERISSKKQAGEELRRMLDELEQYYGSVIWFKDYDDDHAGNLPEDLKRGVLSEDGIYDVLMDFQELPEGV